MVEAAEHAGCKPQSTSKYQKEFLPAWPETRGLSTVTNFGTRNMLDFLQGSTSAWLIYNKIHHFGS